MTRMALVFAGIAMVAWGLWSVFAKLASESMPPAAAMIVSYAASIGVALAYVGLQDGDLGLTPGGVGMAAFAGVFAGVGAVAFYSGLAAGRTATVTTVSALYFVVAAIVGVAVLGETLGLRELAGVAFAIAAVALIAG